MRLGRWIVLLALIGVGWMYKTIWGVTGQANPQTWLSVVQQPQAHFAGKDRIIILVAGKDYNRDSKGMPYSKNARSDTVMLLGLDMASGKAAAVSVPRDSYVQAPDGIQGKINATFARGGVKLLKATLEQTFGLQIDHHLVFKDTAVKEVVNALGGVWVETIDQMHYDDNWGNLHIHLPKGRQKINGEQAIGFVRFREVNTYTLDRRGRMKPIYPVQHSEEEGDIRRTERQQQLLRSMAKEALVPQNLVRLEAITNTALGQLETDLSRMQMAALGARLGRGGLSSLHSTTLPGRGGYAGDAYVYYLANRSQALVDWLIKGDEVAGRRMVNVAVFNASRLAGVARATATRLSGRGYSIQRVDTANERHSVSKIIYKQAAFEEKAREIQSFLRVSEIVKDPSYSEDADVSVFIGSDLGQQMLSMR